MRPITISDLNLSSASNIDSMLSLQKGTLNGEGQPPTDICDITKPYSVMMRPISFSDLNLSSASNIDSMLSLQKGTLNGEGQPLTDICDITEPYSVMMRPISISDLNLSSASNIDSMLSLQKGTLNGKGQPPTDIFIMQPKTNLAQEKFTAKYLEGQVETVEKLRNISNIEIPLGYVLQQSLSETCRRRFNINSPFTGFRQPVFNQPALLLTDHLKKYEVVYENVAPKSQQMYQNAQSVQPDLQSIFIGISNGLAQLHEVFYPSVFGIQCMNFSQIGALAYGLNTRSVFIHKENGRLIAKLSSFSEASLVRQRDKLDLEMGERNVRRLAPEMIDSLEHTCKSDVWVMAILFWESISGFEPYKTYTDDNDAEAAILGGSKLEKPTKCAPKMFDAMMKCWMLDPQNRPSAAKMAKKLSNIKSHGFPGI
ncbi:hypothetical protein CAPTEDRAFT_213230 [Capitella teleta]|uniref:Protein kinase domain-containing protein n=1 Tax=Capitella teleta TaxID=283909 RepID=R7UF55_CAPTE|nr:hypothetical protein CAPTEDRAFT_213230 [Capitella teleta]|eukprot:ELU04850.1 hypothetical protein CAPTEDRAFT_213230 [Capitella teleta]